MPAVTVCAGMVPSAVGARLSNTVTEIGCVTVKPPSLAVTVTVALPAATGLIVTVDPDILAVALPTAEEVTVYVRGSPSGSLKLSLTSTVFALLPTVNTRAATVPTFSGARFACTVTVKVWVAVRVPSLAVTVTVADPTATPVMLMIEPVMFAVALLVALELAV